MSSLKYSLLDLRELSKKSDEKITVYFAEFNTIVANYKISVVPKGSNFHFLEAEFPILCNIGTVAEYNLYNDPVVCLFKLRQFGEKMTELLFQEHQLNFPYDNSFNNRLKALFDERIIPPNIYDFFFLLKDKGNIAVHRNAGSLEDAKTCLFTGV